MINEIFNPTISQKECVEHIQEIIENSLKERGIYILAVANKIAKELDYEKEKIDAIVEDMKSSDYNHLISVFEKEFGNYVTIHK